MKKPGQPAWVDEDDADDGRETPEYMSSHRVAEQLGSVVLFCCALLFPLNMMLQ